MNSKIFYIFFVTLFILVLIVTLFSPIQINASANSSTYYLSGEFLWPVPGFTTITSYFGYRDSPAFGASAFHGAIDIAAPPGTNVVATISGHVIYTGFYGANGFTIIIENSEYTITYSHLNPPLIVNVGDFVLKGSIIAKIGPKNVYNIQNNPYKDSAGNPTNGATTGPHLHFSIKKDGQAVNPLIYISSSSS